MKEKAILRSEQLTKIYTIGEEKLYALNNINIKIFPKESVAIVGTSGSGKSTLLHLLSTLDTPTFGKIFYKDEDLNKLNPYEKAQLRRRKFGFIFQFYNLIPTLTVEENIILPLLIDGKKPDQSYIEKLLEFLSIKNKRHLLPHKLSGGQQQRVGIGRALAAKPEIVFADEPTGNLDNKTTEDVVKLLKETSQEFSQTIIIVTHDMKVAEKSDRILKIEDGEIVDEVKK